MFLAFRPPVRVTERVIGLPPGAVTVTDCEALSVAPYHLVNVTHNLQHSKDISIRERRPPGANSSTG